jgi:glucosyl-3-phosphoglycerate synthase
VTVDDLPRLVEAKAAGGVRISVVIPAYNEAATIEDVVGRVCADLAGPGGLVDEVLVIDSASDDDTAKLAVAAGAQVHSIDSVLPEMAAVRGKGEAIWRSLFVAQGDLIAFLDGDLLEWDTRFVSGVLGPLLTDPGVHLVKGYYDRLVRQDTDGEAGLSYEGGRATELVARPLLARRWPELGRIVQPLAGEWAVRRDTLAACSVPVGYGVDLAALIDVHTAHGTAAVAQVDLGRRAHSHQTLRDLGAMALQLIAATDRRAGIGTPDDVVMMRQFTPGPDRAVPVDRPVAVLERPPAAGLAAYRPAGRRS